MDRVTSSSKLIVILVVLCSLNFYLANCDYMNRKSKQFDPVFDEPFSENNVDYNIYESPEIEQTQMTEQEYLNKLKLLEFILSKVYLREEIDKSVHKRGFGRSLGKDDRRRPGWELAYGKRKRNIN